MKRLLIALLLLSALPAWADIHQFTIASSADEGACESTNDVAYPPAFSDCFTGGTSAISNVKAISEYYINNGFFRWTDSGNLLVGQTITDATLTLCVNAATGESGSALNCEWYPNWSSLTSADFTASSSGSAFSFPIRLLSSGNGGTCVDDTFELVAPDANIQKGGTTALRCTIGGGEPSGSNFVSLPAQGNPAIDARLQVQYGTGPTTTPTPTHTLFPSSPTPTLQPGCTRIDGVVSPLVDEVQTDSNCAAYPPIPNPAAPEHICWNDTGSCDMTVEKNDCSTFATADKWFARAGFLRFTYSIPFGSTIASGGLVFANNNTSQNAGSAHNLLIDYVDPTTFCSNWNPSGPGAAGSLSVASIIANGVGGWNTIPIADTSGIGDTQTAFRFTISGQGTPQGIGRDQADVEISNQCRFGVPSLVLCITPPVGTPPTATVTPSQTVTATSTPTMVQSATPTPTPTITPTEIARCCACPDMCSAAVSPSQCHAPCAVGDPGTVCVSVNQ